MDYAHQKHIRNQNFNNFDENRFQLPENFIMYYISVISFSFGSTEKARNNKLYEHIVKMLELTHRTNFAADFVCSLHICH